MEVKEIISKKYWVVIFFILLFIISGIQCDAENIENLDDKICLQFDRTKSCAIINNSGQTITYDAVNDRITGSMKIIYKTKGETKWMKVDCKNKGIKKIYKVWVDDESSNYTFTPLDEGNNFFCVYFKDISGAKIIADNCKEIKIAKNYYSVEGTNCKYSIVDARFTDYENRYKHHSTYNIFGVTNGKVMLTHALEDEAVLSGVKNTHFWLDYDFPVHDEEDDVDVIDGISAKFYSFEDAINISHGGESDRELISNGICRLCSKQYNNKINTRYIQNVNDGKEMLFTWNTVKKAKSYIVYQYNTKLKRYTKKKLIKNQDINYYLIPVVDNKEIYKFKIAACSDKEGKHIIGKISSPVYAVPSGSSKSNVVRIQLNKKLEAEKYIDVDKGKKLKLKAKLFGKDGKKLLSKHVEWVTSNKNVASISQSGVVIGKKYFGRCEVWARAHNGVESMHLIINVW